MEKNKAHISDYLINDDDLAQVAGGISMIWDDGYQQIWDDGTVTGKPNPWLNPKPDDTANNNDGWL